MVIRLIGEGTSSQHNNPKPPSKLVVKIFVIVATIGFVFVVIGNIIKIIQSP